MENKFFKITSKGDEFIYRWITFKSRASWITLLIFAILLLYMIYMPFIMHLSSKYYLEKKLDNFAQTYTKDTPQDIQKLEKLFNWERENFNAIYDYNQSDLLPFLYYNNHAFMICVRTDKDNDPSWVYLSKCGACGEYALLYNKLVESIGLDVRVIKDSGEDHAWTEVFVDGNWMIIDPSWDGGFNSSHQSLGYNRDVSYVFARYNNGTMATVTSEYTNKTGHLIITINSSLKNININLISKSLDANRETEAECVFTNNTCELEIGARNYTLIVYGGGLIKKYDKQDFEIAEGQTLHLTFNPTKLYLAHWINTKGYAFVLLSVLTFLFWALTGIIFAIVHNVPDNHKNQQIRTANT